MKTISRGAASYVACVPNCAILFIPIRFTLTKGNMRCGSNMMVVVSLTLISLLMLAPGCGKRVEEGQVFIATQGGQNVKMGAVEILAFDEPTINSHKNQKTAEIARQRDKFQQEAASAQADLEKLEEPYHKTMAAYRDVQRRYDDQGGVIRRESDRAKELEGKMREAAANISDYTSKLSEADQKIAAVLKEAETRAAIAQEEATRKEIFSRTNSDPSIIQANNDKSYCQQAVSAWLGKSNELSQLVAGQHAVLVTEKEKGEKIGAELIERKNAAKGLEDPYNDAQYKLDTANKALASFLPASILFSDLPQPAARAVSDAEGKFRLNLPSGGRFAIFAHAQRNVGETEDYIWLVWSTESGELLLNNANLFGSKSSAQIVPNNL
jgi:hypothetical protein